MRAMCPDFGQWRKLTFAPIYLMFPPLYAVLVEFCFALSDIVNAECQSVHEGLRARGHRSS